MSEYVFRGLDEFGNPSDYEDTEPGGANEPRCDLCGEPEDHEPGFIEYDWNGETGNHLSCEERAARRLLSNVLLPLVPETTDHPQRRKRTLLATYEVYEIARDVRDLKERKYRAEGGSGMTEFQVRKTNRGFGVFMRATL